MNKIIKKYIRCFMEINKKNIDSLIECVDENFLFEDSFNIIKGKKEYHYLLNDLIRKVISPKFEIKNCMQDKDTFFIKWKFSGIYKKKFSFEGMSEIKISKNKVIQHIDYWDSGKNFYCKLPIIGSLFRRFHY